MRTFILLAVGFFVIATACSSGSSGFNCCSVTFTGAGLSSICLCGGASAGGCTIDNVGATTCTIKCSGMLNGTFSGVSRATCSSDGGSN